jgi:hypothetical protein
MSYPRVSALLICLVASAPAAAQDTFADAFWRFRATTGFDFSSGKYGADKATEVLYVPVTLQATKGPWTLKGRWSPIIPGRLPWVPCDWAVRPIPVGLRR